MNVYVRCLRLADATIARNREATDTTRWQSVFSYLDETDIYYSDGLIRPLHQIKRRAYHALQANRGSVRRTEFEALYHLFEDALLKKEWQALTRKQKETVALVELSKALGVRESKFISNVLSITQNAANRRLRTLKEKNAQFTPQFAILQIKSALEATPRYCPFCMEQGYLTKIPNPKNSMCWAHHDRFVRRQDFGRYPKDAYEQVVFKSSAEYWQQVRAELDSIV